MIFEWFTKKPKLISRNALRMRISRQCDIQDFTPLNRVYKLIPGRKWLTRRTPICSDYVQDYNDCNHIACATMALTQSHCVGMVIIETTDPLVDHCLNIAMLEDNTLYLYDPMTKEFLDVNYKKIKRIWL